MSQLDQGGAVEWLLCAYFNERGIEAPIRGGGLAAACVRT